MYQQNQQTQQNKQEQRDEDARLHKFQLVNEARFGGLFSPEEVDRLTQKLMNFYDGDQDGHIENMEVRNMMSDAYRAINKEFKPTATDLVQFTRVITRRGDAGKIKGEDIHSLATSLFVGKNVQNLQSMSQQQFVPQQLQQPQQEQQESRKHAAHQVHKPPQQQQYQQQPPQQQQYSQKVQERLQVAIRLFKKIDSDHSGYITEDEVPQLLRDTYAQMGINNYQVSESDVKSWMQMTDTDNDGRVSEDEYVSLVTRSLQKAGISLY